jgi:hypothetical protein
VRRDRLLEERLAAENAFVIDDDDTGEAADVIEIVQGEHDLVIRLFHCKYAHGEQPGVRVSELYEVCGEAVRSSRFTRDPDRLFRHIERRETQAAGGRPTRFETGSL